MNKPPTWVRDGRTGRLVPVNQDAPWDAMSAYMVTLVEAVGFDMAARLLSIPTDEDLR